MSRQGEILDLLRSVNPAPTPTREELRLGHGSVHDGAWLDSDTGTTRQRPAKRNERIPVLIATVAVMAAGLTFFLWGQQNTLSIADLVGDYRGSLIRAGGPGEADVRQLVEVRIAENGDSISAQLIHASAGAATIDQTGNVVMPLGVAVYGSILELRWDQSIGPYQDTTGEQCDWENWLLVLNVQSDGDVLVLESGRVTGHPPQGPAVGEFLSGCPDGERPVNRLVLTRQ